MRDETPYGYMTRMGRRGVFSADWDGMDDRCLELLDEICTKTDIGFDMIEPVKFSVDDLSKADHEDGWRLCMFLARGLVEADESIRDRHIWFYGRYPAMARWRTHGFKPVPATGDPAIANPHRPRAINWSE